MTGAASRAHRPSRLRKPCEGNRQEQTSSSGTGWGFELAEVGMQGNPAWNRPSWSHSVHGCDLAGREPRTGE